MRTMPPYGYAFLGRGFGRNRLLVAIQNRRRNCFHDCFGRRYSYMDAYGFDRSYYLQFQSSDGLWYYHNSVFGCRFVQIGRAHV